MPACENCEHLIQKDGVPVCDLAPFTWTGNFPESFEEKKAANRSCADAIFLKYLRKINGDVLEVGPGMSKTYRRWLTRRRKLKFNGSWTGLEPRWGGGRIVQGTVGKMPFENERFDWVYAFNSMEHWNEYRDPAPKGLEECWRVLKPGGFLLISVPIHLHGSREFFHGDLDKIKGYFNPKKWETTFEEWRRSYSPLPRLEEWVVRHQRVKLLEETGGVMPAYWTLEIFAKKI